ncbi:MAG TPA: complex I subunit 1 family protein [Anaeromyxobacteraceae bacterium]|nr:complex I subunit 1 family protein [Anaeromyxobacteraceae bacterium]
MKRFVGMWLVIGAVLVGLVALFYAFYALAALAAGVAASLGAPPFYGSAIANTVTLMAVLLMTVAALLTVAERKWSAAMQDRVGANRIKVFGTALGGVPYLLADALKMLTKEATYPAARSRLLFELAPVLAFAPTFALFAVVPVGPSVEVLGQQVALVVASPDVGLLWIFALAGLSVYGTTLAGWASNNRAGLLGGVRASSQMISYEVSLGLSLVGVMLAYRTLNLQDMVAAQGNSVLGPVPALGILLQPLAFLVFFTSSFAETKRAPFDLPEGESEIVGYFVEYSGMKFGMMFLAEFVEVVILAGVVTAVFLGGWHPVIFEGLLRANLPPALFGAVCATVFLAKVVLLCWLQLIIRWLLPRFRFDQIQALCWKMLLPAALLNLFVTGAAVLIDPSLELLAWVGIAEIVAIFGVTAAATRAPARAAEHGHDHGHAAHAAGH